MSNLAACSHYLKCIVVEFNEMHPSIPSYGQNFDVAMP